MSPDNQYMTLEEVANLLGVNYQLIYRHVRSGELPAIRIGRVYRVGRSDLDAYIEARRTGPSPGTGGVCSVCGRQYRSRSSLSQECVECGAPICTDCWQRKGEHYCREHRPQSE